jgi:hypothetical protein
MTIYEINILNEKAKTRKDGIFSFRGNLWVVKNHRFIAYFIAVSNFAKLYNNSEL